MRMMKNRIWIALALIMVFALSSCEKEKVRVAGITLDATSMSLLVNDTATLIATVSPANADNKTILWSSDDASVVKVVDGKVEAIAPGTANVTAKADDNGTISASCKITVYNDDIQEIIIETQAGQVLESDILTIKKDESIRLNVSIKPEDATVKTISWVSTNTEVATISETSDQTAVIKGIGTGETDIVVTTAGGGCYATFHIAVVQNASGLSLEPTAELFENEEILLEATVTPEDASETVKWESSDEDVATVLDGKVLARKAGTAVITASIGSGDNTLTATCIVTVKCHVKGVSLKDHSITVKQNETLQLSATVYPERASNTKVSWSSSNTSVATVSETGVLTAKASGTTKITVTTAEGGFKDECEVIVESNVTAIKLSKSELSLAAGEAEDLTVTIEPAGASIPKIRWYSTDSQVVVVVDKEGKGHVEAVAPGEAVICATTDGGLHAFCQVLVGSKAEKITLDKKEMTLYTTDTQNTDTSNRTLTAIITPPDAAVSLKWTSDNESVVTAVKGSGNTCILTPVGRGKATVRVSTQDGRVFDSATITVKQPYTNITLNKKQLSLDGSKTETLTAVASPQDADDSIVWLSDKPDVATVDNNGKVTAVNAGTAVITAASKERPDDVKDQCIVTVTSSVIHVTGVTVTPTNLTLSEGESRTIFATIAPTNAENKSMSWHSSNESVATVSDYGNVVALSVGTATITVTTEDGGHKATCNVTVLKNSVGVTSLTLDKSDITLSFGNYERIEATILPENATNKNIIWGSSDQTVAKVDNGTVTAMSKEGTAVITATSEDNPSLSATCTVKVVRQLVPVDGLTVEPSILNIYMGQTKQLKATVSPSNATDQSVTWSVQQGGVAAVDQNGVVTPLKVGTTRVVVRTNDGGYSKSVQVTVTKNDVGSIQITSAKVVLKVGETYDLTATVTGQDTSAPASNTNVTWSSSKSTVASVAAFANGNTDTSKRTGRITARQAGETTITVTSSDNPGVKVTCQVTVLDGGSSGGGNEGVEFEDWNF